MHRLQCSNYWIAFWLLALLTGCQQKGIAPGNPGPPVPSLIFNSGFEPDTQGIPADAHELLQGKDNSLETLSDWQADLNEQAKIGDFNIQYQGGDATMRYARIIDDPTNPGNKVLWYWLNEANVFENNIAKKGRIQANIYGNTGITAMAHSSRVYLHPDFNYLKTVAPTIGWLTLYEYWNNPNWLGSPYPFRITVNLNKTAEGPVDALYFQVHGQQYANNRWQNIWEEVNTAVPVPIGEWYTTEIYFLEGDAGNGRFTMTITPANGTATTVFAITNYTHHPNDPAPDGLSHFNPLKLYTSASLIDSMRANGKTLQVYWDDFTLKVNE